MSELTEARKRYRQSDKGKMKRNEQSKRWRNKNPDEVKLNNKLSKMSVEELEQYTKSIRKPSEVRT